MEVAARFGAVTGDDEEGDDLPYDEYQDEGIYHDDGNYGYNDYAGGYAHEDDVMYDEHFEGDEHKDEEDRY